MTEPTDVYFLGKKGSASRLNEFSLRLVTKSLAKPSRKHLRPWITADHSLLILQLFFSVIVSMTRSETKVLKTDFEIRSFTVVSASSLDLR